MAEMVHDGWYALRGVPDDAMHAEQVQQAVSLYRSGMPWRAMVSEMHTSYITLSSLLREGGVRVGSQMPYRAPIVAPEPVAPIEKWTREVQATPSPCMDAALDRHTAAIVQMHASLGIAPPVLP